MAFRQHIQKRRTKMSRQARETGREGLSNVFKLIKTYFHWNSNSDLNFGVHLGRPQAKLCLIYLNRLLVAANGQKMFPMIFRSLREAN